MDLNASICNVVVYELMRLLTLASKYCLDTSVRGAPLSSAPAKFPLSSCARLAFLPT